MVRLLLVLLAIPSVVFSKSIQDILINQNGVSSEVIVSLKDINSENIKIVELSNPKRIYFDVENATKEEFISFTRKFNDKSVAVKELRVWFHEKIANKKDVYRVVLQLDENEVKDFKVVKKNDQKLHIFLYPPKKSSLADFNWSTNTLMGLKQTAVADADDAKKVLSESSIVGLDYNEFKEFGKLNFSFNGKIPEYNFSLDKENKCLVMKFSSDFRLNNKEISRVFQDEMGNLESIKFLGQDNDEKAIFSVVFSENVDLQSLIIEESLNGISLSIFDKKDMSSEMNFVELNKIWDNVVKNTSVNFVEKVYAQEVVTEKIPDKIKIIDTVAVLREEALPYSKEVAKLKKDMRFKVLGFNDGYYKVKNKNKIGYVFKSYTDASVFVDASKKGNTTSIVDTKKMIKEVAKSTPKEVAKVSSQSKFYIVNVNNLNLRTSPNTSSKVKTMLQKNSKVVELKKQGAWSKIELLDNAKQTGWVMNKMLKEDLSMNNVGTKSLVVMNKNISDTMTVIPKDQTVSFKRHKELGPFIPRFKETGLEDSAPNLAFLSLVGIIYDEYDKIALFESRDKELSKTIFTMREGDRVKSGKLYKIEKDKVVFLMTMFGITKTQVLKLENKDK